MVLTVGSSEVDGGYPSLYCMCLLSAIYGANAFVLVVLNMILHCNNSLRAQCNSYKDSLMKG
jgi:hypothetical protein